MRSWTRFPARRRFAISIGVRAQGWHVGDRGIDGNTTNSPRRRDGTGATFQGPRPKDRGSVGSTQVCRWPPGGVSGALRPPQSPQDLEETSLTSLWRPHRKVKQRGSKVRVSGPFLGGRCGSPRSSALTLGWMNSADGGPGRRSTLGGGSCMTPLMACWRDEPGLGSCCGVFACLCTTTGAELF